MFNPNRFDAYKLAEDGTLEPIEPDRLQEYFISANILTVYFLQQKRLYIWIGENASPELRKRVPTIEETLVDMNSEYRILRHFTLDGQKYETIEFLNMLQIEADKFEEQVKERDRKHYVPYEPYEEILFIQCFSRAFLDNFQFA